MKMNSGQICLLFLLIAIFSCDNPTSPVNVKAIFSGEIKNAAKGEPVSPVYIFESDSLISTVDQNNHYSIELDYGEHEITFSALGFLDNVVPIKINGNIQKEIKLTENSASGRIYGEFQNLVIFQQKIAEFNNLKNWTEKEIMDGMTGATIQGDYSDPNFEQAQLFIGDSLMGYADVWGQYWMKVQCGTYPLTGKSKGFLSKTRIVKVLPESKIYINFYLKPQPK